MQDSSSADNRNILESVRLGNRDAIESLLKTHRPYLKQVVRLRIDPVLKARVDPSDIVQEAHLEATRRIADYVRNPEMPVRLWMRQIAIDRLGMAHRRHIGADRRTVHRELVLPEQSSISIARQLVSGIPSPSAAVVRAEIVAQVRQAVADLGNSDREILMLQAFEGLNSRESAQVLGIEPATARKRFGRALLRLRQKLVSHGLGDVARE